MKEHYVKQQYLPDNLKDKTYYTPGQNATEDKFRAYLEKIKKEHPELDYFYIPEEFKEKDFSDFYKKYGKDEATKFLNKYILNA